MTYVSLHTHGHRSILDGLSTEEEIVEAAAAHGQTAVALTDHGSLSGALAFQKACAERNIKPIFGQEFYVAPAHRSDREARALDGRSKYYHLILLAKNMTGWKNLVRLSTEANYPDAYYFKPRIDRELMAKYSEGLICLSACLAGELAQTILTGGDIHRVIEEHRELYGDDYILEVQNHGIEDEDIVRDVVEQASTKHDLPIVATGDSHYAFEKDAGLHDTLLCIQTLDRKDNPERKFQFHGSGYHLQSEAEMLEKHSREAVSNSGYIASWVEHITFDTTPHIPAWELSDGYLSSHEAIMQKVVDAVQEKYASNTTAAIMRAGRELAVIQHHGFEDYFLIVADIVRWAREHGITVGPGRGSAGGSIVAYLLGITQVDPLRFNTLFERFMTKERLKMPDVDVDFSSREPVIRYIQDTYGADRVAQVATFSTFGERAALRDVARALALDEGDPVVNDTADRLRGRVRGISRHAAGLIISPDPIYENVPLMRPVGKTAGANMQTQFEYGDMESLGFLKVDILGVQRLQTISDAAKYANVDIERSTAALDDVDVYRMLARADVSGVFQLDSYGGRKTIRAMRPTCFEDLVIAISLDRPGPMESGALDLYMQRRHAQGLHVAHVVPAVEEILKDTLGVLVFQEQVMEIAQKVAGYTPGEADEFRAAMGKKKPAVMEAQRTQFVNGFMLRTSGSPSYPPVNEVAVQAATTLFDQIAHYAGYCFNRSHAVAYALIAYQCAYLKCHHPIQWYTALLNERRDEQTKLRETCTEVRKQGIAFLGANIFRSKSEYTAEGNGIRVGLTGLQDFGEVAYRALQEALRNCPNPQSLYELVKATNMSKCNSKAMTALIKAGAMDSLGDKSALLQELPEAIERKKREYHEWFKGEQAQKGLTLAGTPLRRKVPVAS